MLTARISQKAYQKRVRGRYFCGLFWIFLGDLSDLKTAPCVFSETSLEKKNEKIFVKCSVSWIFFI